MNQEAVRTQAAWPFGRDGAAWPLGGDGADRGRTGGWWGLGAARARGPAATTGISSCVVVVRCENADLTCSPDLEGHVSRAVWDAVEVALGDPDVLTVDVHGDRVIVRARFGPQVGEHVDLVAAIREPVVAAVSRVGRTPTVVLGLAVA